MRKLKIIKIRPVESKRWQFSINLYGVEMEYITGENYKQLFDMQGNLLDSRFELVSKLQRSRERILEYFRNKVK